MLPILISHLIMLHIIPYLQVWNIWINCVQVQCNARPWPGKVNGTAGHQGAYTTPIKTRPWSSCYLFLCRYSSAFSKSSFIKVFWKLMPFYIYNCHRLEFSPGNITLHPIPALCNLKYNIKNKKVYHNNNSSSRN